MARSGKQPSATTGVLDIRLLAIGCYFDSPDVTNVDLPSLVSAFEYDAVLLDLTELLAGYQRDVWNRTYRGLPNISDDDSARLEADIDRRRQEFLEYLRGGGLLICFTPPPVNCYIDSGQREHSGTGRNQSTTKLVKDCNLHRILPVSFLTQAGSGQTVTWVGGERDSLLRPIAQLKLRYQAYVTGETEPESSPLFTAGRSGRAVGLAVHTGGGGLLVFTPHLDYESTEDEQALDRDFLEIIRSVVVARRSNSGAVVPSWFGTIELPGEAATREALSAIDTRLAELTLDRDSAVKAVADAAAPKNLVAAAGDPLRIAAIDALRQLGCRIIEEADAGRRDILIEWSGMPAVVEVKGLSGSAAEKHAAQLEKWVGEYLAEHGVTPKAILLVNGFKDVSPTERLDPVFPSQMIPYSTKRDHALVTTVQLLSATLEDADRRSEFMDVVFGTSGVVDWPVAEILAPNSILTEAGARGSEPEVKTEVAARPNPDVQSRPKRGGAVHR